MEENLKAQALLERVTQLTAQYEDALADARVEVTRLGREVNQLKSILTQQEAQASAKSSASEEVVEPDPLDSP